MTPLIWFHRMFSMNNKEVKKQDWLFEITPKNNFFELNLREIWNYRDLIFLFVKRDVVTVYKQTVLGPLWYLIQPLFTSITFTIIFNNLAGIDTGKVPPFLFNLAGITIWNYFTSCLTLVILSFRLSISSNCFTITASFSSFKLFVLALFLTEANLFPVTTAFCLSLTRSSLSFSKLKIS